MEPKGNVLAALCEMRKSVEGVNKEKKAGMQFETVSYDGLLDVIRDKAIEHGLFLVPHKCTQTNCTPYEAQRGQRMARMNCDSYIFDFRLYHVSGEWLDISTPSVGIDTDDKGPGKATTYASKNAWMQALMLKRGKGFEVDEPNDADRNASREDAYNQNRQAASAPKIPQYTADPKTWPADWQKVYSDLLVDVKDEKKFEDLETVNWVNFVNRVDAGLNKGSCPTVIAQTIMRGATVHLLATLLKTTHAPATAELVNANLDVLERHVGKDVLEQIKAKVANVTPF